MRFEKDKSIEKAGTKVGYVLGYLIFTTVLYFILKILGKIPESWNYLHIAAITLMITLIGIIIKRFLK